MPGRVTKKSVRYDGSFFGATVRIGSIEATIEDRRRKVIQETWRNVDRAAEIAAERAESLGKAAITAAGRVDTGYMRESFAVKPAPTRGGKKTVKIGWPNWKKPTEYYDFQERGTKSNRVNGYGGQRFVGRKVKIDGKQGRGGNTDGNGIVPMLVIPGVVDQFRRDFMAVLKGMSNG